MNPADQQPSPTPPALTDGGLRCPVCEYNLTGLADDVCPECGETFDREQLLAQLAGAPQPIPIWSRRHERGMVRTFLITVLEIWLSPISYAKKFPHTPERRDPVLFARACLFVALLVLSAAFLPFTDWRLAALIEFIFGSVFVFLAWTGGLALLEVIIAASAFAPPSLTALDKPWFRDALALSRMMRAHIVPLSLGIIFKVWTAMSDSLNPMYDTLSTAGLVAMVLYWWVAVILTATTYRKSLSSGLIALIMVPVSVFIVVSALQICALIFGPILGDLLSWLLSVFS